MAKNGGSNPLIKRRVMESFDEFAALVKKASDAADAVYEASVQQGDESAKALINDQRLEALWDLESFFEGWVDS